MFNNPTVAPIALPPQKKLVVADANDVKTLDNFNSEKQVEVWLQPQECTDYVYDKANNVCIAQVKCITINGTQFNLVPGKNKVPLSVAQFLEEANAAALEAERPIPARRLTNLY